MLLQFDLQQQTTVTINGAEYDKAAILSFFEELKTDGEFHLRIYQNKGLLNFLEKGNIRFFSNRQSWPDLDDPAFRQWVSPYFIEQMSALVYKCANEKGEHSIKRITAILQSGFKMEAGMQDQVFSKTFTFLNQFVKKANEAALAPFVEKSDSKFKKEMGEYLHPHYLSLLKVLPQNIFQPIILSYSDFARNVLSRAFYKDRKFAEFKKFDLNLLVNATNIYLQGYPDDREIRDLSKAIRSAMNGMGELFGGGPIFIVIRVIGIALLVFAIRMGCNPKKSRSYNNKEFANLFERTNLPDMLAMAGNWESVPFAIGEDSMLVKRELNLTSLKDGMMRWVILDEQGKEICSVSRAFTWSVTSMGWGQKAGGGKPKTMLQFRYDAEHKLEKKCEDPTWPVYRTFQKIEKYIPEKDGVAILEPFTFDKVLGTDIEPIFIVSQQELRKKPSD